MATFIEWEGHKIEIKSRFSPKYFILASRLLMLATETKLFVDENLIGKADGLHFTKSISGSFSHKGKPTRIELEIRKGLFQISYLLSIDGSSISQGILQVEKIGRIVLLWLVFVAIILILVLFLKNKI